MKITSTYSVKIKHYSRLLKDTVWIYRRAVDFFVNACLLEWEQIELLVGSKRKLNYIERLCISTKKHPEVIYDFEHTDHAFYKFPCYLRRAAISEALGKVSSYKSNLKNGQDASPPKAGFVYPAMYRDNMYVMTGTYTARIKVFIRNTWDWISIDLKKSDVKCRGSTPELHLKLHVLSAGEGSGIPSVAVKCVDIRRNTSGEGGFLDDN